VAETLSQKSLSAMIKNRKKKDMKTKIKLAIMAAALMMAAQAYASLNISSMDTGATTVVGGTVDANWTVSLLSGGPQPGPLTGLAYVVPNGSTYSANGGTYALVPGAWLANDSTSSWISYYNLPTLPDETDETMQYQLRFDAAGGGSVNVSFLSDNTGTLIVNGVTIGNNGSASSTFGDWTTFTVNLNTGLNTIDLDVNNLPQSANPTWGNPTGGRLEFSGSVNVSPVPEPATLISGALLLLPFGASTLRILRRKCVA